MQHQIHAGSARALLAKAGSMNIEIKLLTDTARVPTKATEGSAAFDLYADLAASGSVTLHPGDRALIKTGFAMAFPPGYAALVCPRSGLALKHGITVLNAPGIIDSDYRGEGGVVLFNGGKERFTVFHGDRIAQLMLVILPSAPVLSQVTDLTDTARGTGGFGSSGS